MLTEFLIIAVGLVIILLLSELVIRNAIELAEHFHLTGTFIGLTVLSLGTSIPEIMTHVVGSVTILRQPETMDTVSALMIGTNIGSDIFQQIFVLPIVGIIGTVLVHRKNLIVEVGALIGAAILVWVFTLSNEINRVEGFILIVAYLAYLLYLAKHNHLLQHVEAERHNGKRKVIIALGLIFLSFVIMSVVTDRVVDASINLVDMLPISASFFGIIILGIATALPELSTSLISIWKGQKGISAGILIGSNITNPLLGIGIGALISGYTVPDAIVYFDLPVKIVTAFVLFIFLWRQDDLTNKEAISLILMYIAYVYSRDIFYPQDFPVSM